MRTEIKTITPEMAEKILLKNTTNRLLNHHNVESYAKQILNGEWQLNGESIKFSKSGRLIDGQHRLSAVIKSGESIQTLVIYELEDSSFLTLDTGKPRNASDVFKILDIKNNTNVTSGLAVYLLLKHGLSISLSGQKITKISNKNILDEYKRRPDYYQNIHSKSESFYKDCFRIVRKSEYFGFSAVYEDYHGEVIYKFWDAFLKKDGVAGLLYNRLMSDMISKSSLPRRERFALFIKAINYFLERKELKQLKFSSEEQNPVIRTKRVYEFEESML